MIPIRKNFSCYVSLCVEEGSVRDRNNNDPARPAQWQMQVCWQTLGEAGLGGWWVGWC